MAKGSPMVNTDGYRNVVFSVQVPQYFHVKVIKTNDRQYENTNNMFEYAGLGIQFDNKKYNQSHDHGYPII